MKVKKKIDKKEVVVDYLSNCLLEGNNWQELTDSLKELVEKKLNAKKLKKLVLDPLTAVVSKGGEISAEKILMAITSNQEVVNIVNKLFQDNTKVAKVNIPVLVASETSETEEN